MADTSASTTAKPTPTTHIDSAAPFGTVFGDALPLVRYQHGTWSPLSCQPLADLSLHPASHALHYGSSCFEGLKAYRWADGSARLFRVDRHVARLRQSAELLCLPCPDDDVLYEMIRLAVSDNRDAIPAPPGALYLRPTLLGTEPNIGAAGSPSRDAMLFVLSSPVGNYFAGGDRALRILIDDQNLRAPSGFGCVKTGANYASALRHTIAAQRSWQADQVLFCPGGDVQETGASNFILINDQQLLTKPLDDSFLHGVTRDSVLKLAAKLGYQVSERDFSVEEIFTWLANGGEAALSGTAAVLAGVGTFIHNGREVGASNGQTGANTKRLRDTLTALQRGDADDPFGWTSEVK